MLYCVKVSNSLTSGYLQIQLCLYHMIPNLNGTAVPTRIKMR